MKRYLVLVLILILASVGGYYYFSGGEASFSKDSSVYKAIPNSAPLFIEVSSARSVSFSNAVINELEKAGIGKSWFDVLQQADSLVDHFDKLPKSLLNAPFIISWSYAGRNQMIPLLITKAESANRQRSFQALINAFYPPENFSYNEKEYGEQMIAEIKGNSSSGLLYYSFTDGLLLVSTRQILIEQVILQMSAPGILKNPYFREVNHAAGSEGISLFINHARFEGFFGNILNRKAVERVDEFGATVRFQPAVQASAFRDYAGWSGLDVRFEDEQVLLTGVTAADDSLNHFITVFNDQQPVRYSAGDVLPVNTSFFCSYSFSDKKAFFERLEDFYAHSGSYYHREERMKRFDKGFRSNTRSMFMQLLKDEVIVAAGIIPVNPENKTVYFIMHTNGKKAAEEQIRNQITSYATRAKMEPADFMSEFSVDNEIKFAIYRFPYPSFPGLWLGSPFTMVSAKYVSFYNNYMVFANTEEGLQEYFRNMVLGTTLSKDDQFRKFSQNRHGRGNLNVFVDVNKIFSYRNELFSEFLLKPVNEKEESIRKFNMINWQVQRDKTGYLNSVAVTFQPVAGDEAKTTWQSVIGSQVQSKPQLVVNHTEPSSREIIFQDSQNNLTQVTGSGRVRWSTPLNSPILSEIFQVDVHKNGRFQYLFNTKEKLYLIDRNGNHVAPFPVTFASPATNGVNVFDYDNNRNYRIFVAGEDHRVYVYDLLGKAIKGWNFDKTGQAVKTPVQHFRIEGKDYIVIKDQTSVYILDRQGEPRVSVPSRIEFSDNLMVLNPEGKPRLAATDKNGKVYYIGFDGTIDEIKTARFSENHFFTAADLDGNKVLDFIFADGNEVTVMDEKGKKLFNRKFNSPLHSDPAVYSFSPELKKVGVTDAATNRIYLINPDGKLHEGFPLQGNSEFTIGKLANNATGLNLIVGSQGGKLYNYTLN